MRINKLFKTEKEYLDYAWSFIGLDKNKIWREEDLVIMNPFFDFDRIRHKIQDEEGSFKKYWTPEIDAGYKHYLKCKEEYADDLFDIRDAIRGFNQGELLEFFFIHNEEDMPCWDYDSEGNEIDENGNIIPLPAEISRETLKEKLKEEIIFPITFIGWIDSGWDRSGDYRITFSDYVNMDINV